LGEIVFVCVQLLFCVYEGGRRGAFVNREQEEAGTTIAITVGEDDLSE
jgi:hypothetical protein